jgi:hypothetical protein
MLKLYRLTPDSAEYWETWEQEHGEHIVHWGVLGTRGTDKTIRSSFLRKTTNIIQKEIDRLVADGFAPISPEEHAVLMIEYAVEGMGSPADLDKRHELEARMNELLGWTGLGICDGGSIGSGTMEVCNFVVDFALAKQTIEADLAGTKFADYSRIYDEGQI